MDTFATERFTLITTCDAGCVWGVITESGERVEHLYGLAVQSTWETGAALTVGVRSGEQLAGEILNVDPPHRLSYTLRSGPGQPSVYVTWEIEPHSGGTLVRLYIDEPAPVDATDIEEVWTPVVTAIEQRLQTSTCRGARPEGTASDEHRSG